LIKSKTLEPRILIPCKNLRLLRPPNELLGFRYLNKIGAENEHFNSTTLNDKNSPKVYKTDSSNRQTLQTCKETYNFKVKT
jgi:hypothetical protein